MIGGIYMSILGEVASLYMAILIILLIISFGLIGLKLVNYILTIDYTDTKSKDNTRKSEMKNSEVSRWLRAALYSLLGLIITFLILSILNPTTSFVNAM